MDKLSKLDSFDDLGIFKKSDVDYSVAKKYSWLTPDEKWAIIELYLYGEGGMHKKLVDKLLARSEDCLARVEGADGLLEWEFDKSGRKMILHLTWKGLQLGQALMEFAKRENTGHK